MQALGFGALGFADASQPGGAIVFQIAKEPAGCAAANRGFEFFVTKAGKRTKGFMKRKNTIAIHAVAPPQAGFSMVGTMIGTFIVGVVTVGGTYMYADYKQDEVAQGRGKQLGMSRDQVNGPAIVCAWAYPANPV